MRKRIVGMLPMTALSRAFKGYLVSTLSECFSQFQGSCGLSEMWHTWESREATIGGSESHRRDETGGSDKADWWTYPMPSYVLHAGYNCHCICYECAISCQKLLTDYTICQF